MSKKSMLDYVLEATPLASNIINNYKHLLSPLLQVINKDSIQNIWLIASGSSYNASHCARPLMKKCMTNEIKIITPYTFTHYEHDIKQNDLVLIISQSGFSTNAISAVKKVKSLHHPAIVLTGNINSNIKNYADIIIDYGVQEESVGYVTKGVTILTLFLMLFSIELSTRYEYVKEIKNAITFQKEMQNKTMSFIKQHYKYFTSMHQCYLIGANSSYGVALEGALKIGETVHIPSNAFEIEEYIHGPNLQLTPNYTVIIFDNNDMTSKRTEQIYQATKKVTNRVFMISENSMLKDDTHVLQIGCTVSHECLSLLYLPFVQLLSYYVSSELKSIYQHPLLKEFKILADAKTVNYINNDDDM